MDHQGLTGQLNKLKELIRKAGTSSLSDLELQSHWARHLCVIAAGFLENALRDVYSDFVKGSASPQVAAFAISMLSGLRNPKAGRFVDIAARFEASWGSELERYLEESGGKDAMDSIMANRNLIAHGRDSGITIARLKSYLEKSIPVIEFIENQCKGRNGAHRKRR